MIQSEEKENKKQMNVHGIVEFQITIVGKVRNQRCGLGSLRCVANEDGWDEGLRGIADVTLI